MADLAVFAPGNQGDCHEPLSPTTIIQQSAFYAILLKNDTCCCSWASMSRKVTQRPDGGTPWNPRLQLMGTGQYLTPQWGQWVSHADGGKRICVTQMGNYATVFTYSPLFLQEGHPSSRMSGLSLWFPLGCRVGAGRYQAYQNRSLMTHELSASLFLLSSCARHHSVIQALLSLDMWRRPTGYIRCVWEKAEIWEFIMTATYCENEQLLE